MRRALAAAEGTTALLALVALLAAGCARDPGPARSLVGRTCAACGMEIRDPRYAALRIGSDGPKPYDSIECALRGATPGATSPAPRAGGSGRLYLADYETGALHLADSLTIVRARIPSPMGAGLAAFLDRAEAEQVAASRDGVVLAPGDLATGATP